MCEYCNNPFASNNPDEHRIEFSGFFSVDAINAAVQKAQQLRRKTQEDDDDDDDDGDDKSDGT
jgi:hypothetical protein